MDMAKELTEKQENFIAEYIVNGGNASAAYRVAYDCSKMLNSSVWVNACKLTKAAKVVLRIEEYKDKMMERSLCSIEELNDELTYARDLADTDGDFKELRANAMDRGKLHGLLIDKKEITGKDGESLCLLDHALLAAVLTDEAKKQLNFEEA